uniref:Uncharacterized protein n=1 Tax=Anguilla anguilla TaxID=7936 RepID=A0A0E9RUL9_ANGAN
MCTHCIQYTSFSSLIFVITGVSVITEITNWSFQYF